MSSKIERTERWIGRHVFLVLWVNLIIAFFFGGTRLEPAMLGWFWGPIIAVATTPQKSSSWRWGVRHRYLVFFAAWVFNTVILNIFFWSTFVRLDGILHSLRQNAGLTLRLGGQAGFFIAVSLLFGVLVARSELSTYLRERRQREFYNLYQR